MTVSGVAPYSDSGTTSTLTRGNNMPRVTETAPTVTEEVKTTQAVVTTTDQQKPQVGTFDREAVRKAADQIEAAAAAVDVQLQFRIDPETSIVQMVITDPETNEVVLEIPPEDVLKAASSVKDIIGLLIDTTV